MIRLRFVLGRGWASQAIAWFSQGHLSHVDCVLPDGSLLGARWDKADGISGVQIRRPNYEPVREAVLVDIPATEAQARMHYQFLYDQIDKPYDSAAIWAFAVNRNWREEDAWICSELQAAALEDAGICPQLYQRVNKLTPVALALVCSALGARQL